MVIKRITDLSFVCKQAKVWDINRCFLTKCFQGHAAAVFAVDMNEDGGLVLTGSADKVFFLKFSNSFIVV